MADSIERFSGFADLYDEVRPVPPVAFTDVLSQLARMSRPAVVVDLGSGTGASAVIWTGRADRVVCVEPNGDIRIVPYTIDRSAATHAARNDSFRDHWGSQPMSDEQWETWTSGTFRPEVSFLAIAGVLGGVEPALLLGLLITTVFVAAGVASATFLAAVWTRQTRDAVIGLYLPGDSVVHRAPAGVKFGALAFIPMQISAQEPGSESIALSKGM